MYKGMKLAKHAIDKEKQKMLDKAEQLETAKQVRLLADRDIFTDKILLAVGRAQFNSNFIKSTIKRRSGKEEQHVLMLSDAQVGTKIVLESTGGINEYNKEKRKLQFNRLFNTVRTLANRHKKSAFIRKLNIFGLGDYVEGVGIFPGQAHHIDQDICDQAVQYAADVSNFLIGLLDTYEEIEVWTVPGNHGRIGNKGENPPWANWDNMVFTIVKERVSNYNQIKINMSMAQWQVADIFGYKFLLMHGDTMKSWNNIPFYGIQRADGKMSQLLNSIDLNYEYMCLGHFHSPAELPRVKGEILINGCWPGGSLFAINVLMTSGRPMQKFFGVHPEQGKTYSYPIWLDI